MRELNKSTILLMHQLLVNTFGGSHGIRDEGMLESALAMPFMTFGDEDLYSTLEAKAAQLCFGLVKNHPFIDGNKRIGAHALETMLEMNGVELAVSNRQLQDCILLVATGEMEAAGLTEWLQQHSKVESL